LQILKQIFFSLIKKIRGITKAAKGIEEKIDEML
jgi:hypothetical protein